MLTKQEAEDRLIPICKHLNDDRCGLESTPYSCDLFYEFGDCKNFRELTLSQKQRIALEKYWGMPLKVKYGQILAKKRGCWRVLCSVSAGVESANILLKRWEE